MPAARRPRCHLPDAGWPSEQKIVRRIGEASLGLYQELLELGD
jgi:hypothetical protein